ncbi:MAG: endolytic transglycosylase MltG [Clostridiaceae bacterium]|nr:endolytic transglycosylase MltG [Clostridiaceae bacterium]
MFSKKVRIAFQALLIIIAVVGCGILGVFLGYNYVMSQTQRFDLLEKSMADGQMVIDETTPGSIMLVIATGDNTPAIAKKLKNEGLIENEVIYVMMSKLNGFDGGYLAGTHFLTKNLTYDEIMYILCQEPKVTRVTFPEGMSYIQIKNKLKDAGLTFDESELDEYMNSSKMFVNYSFVSDIASDEERDYVLNGYLFPDTYDFDMNADSDAIIRTFLRNMEVKLQPDYYERAKKLGMSMDEVMTLASLIQSETTDTKDMLFVSAVFHNRLKSTDPSLRLLGSCATINFLREKDGLPPVWAATSADILRDSPYNTYKFEGLPPGPICMPGVDAIQAALYPEPNVNYLYFCATGIKGGTAFAVTYEEHLKNIELYSQNWNDDGPAIDDEDLEELEIE